MASKLEWYFYYEDRNGKRWEYGPYLYEDASDQRAYYEKMNPERTYYLEQRHHIDEDRHVGDELDRSLVAEKER